MKIDKKIIKELSDYLDEFNLTELEYTEKDTKIKVSKKNSTDALSVNPVEAIQVVKGKENYSIYCKEKIIVEKNISQVILGYFYFKKIDFFNNGYKFMRDKTKNSIKKRDINNNYRYFPVDIDKYPLNSIVAM